MTREHVAERPIAFDYLVAREDWKLWCGEVSDARPISQQADNLPHVLLQLFGSWGREGGNYYERALVGPEFDDKPRMHVWILFSLFFPLIRLLTECISNNDNSPSSS